MKKMSSVFVVCLLAMSVSALDFFGIEHNGNTADNVVNLIYSLVEGNQKAVDEYYGRLQETDSSLARKVNVDNLKIPCISCMGKGTIGTNETCPVCSGSGTVVDSQSLGYLQYRFCGAIDAGKSERAAWKEAQEVFEQRRAAVLEREMLSGTVLGREGNGLLLTRQENEETVYLQGVDPQFDKGASIHGYVWPNGKYTFCKEDGSSVEVESYTATLWMD